jgi:hypothetical protein
MNQEEFIRIIKIAVEQPSIDGVVSSLKLPPGKKKPEEFLVQLSIWFNQLNEVEKEQVKNIIKMAVKHSIFGFLCVLDGVRSIRETNDGIDPVLKLIYNDSENEIVLNDPEQDFLHDIYRAL